MIALLILFSLQAQANLELVSQKEVTLDLKGYGSSIASEDSSLVAAYNYVDSKVLLINSVGLTVKSIRLPDRMAGAHVGLSGDGRLLLTCVGRSDRVLVYDTATGRRRHDLALAAGERCLRLVASRRGKFFGGIFSKDGNDKLRVYSTDSGSIVYEHAGELGRAFGFLGDESRLFHGVHFDFSKRVATYRTVNLESLKFSDREYPGLSRPTYLTISSDDQLAVSELFTQIFSRETGEMIYEWQPVPYPDPNPRLTRFSADLRHVGLMGVGSPFWLVDLFSQSRLPAFDGKQGEGRGVSCLAFLTELNQVISGGPKGVYLWDVNSQEPLQKIMGPVGECVNLSLVDQGFEGWCLFGVFARGDQWKAVLLHLRATPKG